MTGHRLVDVHRVHAGAIETGQPHVADNNQLERIVRILEPLGQFLTGGLRANMALPGRFVAGRAAHDHFDHAFGVVIRMPLGTQLHDRIVQGDTNPSAHADDHGFAIDRLQPLLEMLHEVSGDQAEALVGSDHRFQGGPFRFQFFPGRLLLTLGNLFELFVDARRFLFVQLQFGQSRFVVNRDGRPVLDSPQNVVLVDVVSKDGRGILVVQFHRCSGEADEGRMGK